MIFREIKVIEIASVLAAPMVGQFFAELGATVIKVENLKTQGDITRKWFVKNEDTSKNSSYFCAANLSKQSIALDLSISEGQQIVYQLLEQADVLLMNFKPGDSKKFGLDTKLLMERFPKLIIGEISGYGNEDTRTGYDAVIQAESGFMYLNREPDHTPLKMPVALIDLLAAHHLKEALLLAYIHKLKTGEGKCVSVSLIDAAIASLANQATAWLISHQSPEPMGSEHPAIFPYGSIYQTADNQFIMLAVGNDKEFQNLCSILHIHEVASNPDYASNALRVKNRNELRKILKNAFAKFSRDELLRFFYEKKVPAAPILNIPEVFQLPHAQKLMAFYQNQVIGLRSIAFEGFEQNQLSNSPRYAEHTLLILKQLGYNDTAIKHLIDNHVVFSSDEATDCSIQDK